MDEILLSKVRLAVVAQLVPAEWLTFRDLQRSLDASNGNLGAHLRRLVEAGYIAEQKRFERRRPQTRYRLTPAGRNALVHHVAELQALVRVPPADASELGSGEKP